MPKSMKNATPETIAPIEPAGPVLPATASQGGHAARTSAARVAAVLCGIGALYAFFVASALSIAWNLPRRILPLDPEQQALVFEALIGHAGLLVAAAAGYLAVRRRGRLPTWTPKAMSTVLVAIGFVSLDRLVGIYFPPSPSIPESPFELHAERGWTNRPNGTGLIRGFNISFDRWGLRLDEAEGPQDFAGKKRLLFVGDSITVGYWHQARFAYGRQAVEVLNRRHPGATLAALNGGTCGYDLAQELHWLRHEGLALAPNLVIVQLCLNDVTSQFDSRTAMVGDTFDPFLDVNRLTSCSGIRRALKALVMRTRFGADPPAIARSLEEEVVVQAALSDLPENLKARWNVVLELLGRFAETCERARVPMVLVYFPLKQQIAYADFSDLPQRTLAKRCRELGIPFLDLLPGFREAIGTGDVPAERAMIDAVHPTRLGHQVAGEALAAFLEDHHMIADLPGGGGRAAAEILKPDGGGRMLSPD